MFAVNLIIFVASIFISVDADSGRLRKVRGIMYAELFGNVNHRFYDWKFLFMAMAYDHETQHFTSPNYEYPSQSHFSHDTACIDYPWLDTF